MKGCDTHLEGESTDQEQEADQQHRRAAAQQRRVRHSCQVRRSRLAVDECNAQEHEATDEGPVEEVLDAGLRGDFQAAVIGGQRVEADREQFESEKQSDQLGGSSHEESTGPGPQQERGVLAGTQPFAAQVAVGSEQSQKQAKQNHPPDSDGERCGHEQTTEARAVGGADALP